MHLSDRFTISLPPEAAYRELLDLRNVAPCVPGAEIDQPDGDGAYPGRIVVRLGPMKFTYAGSLRISGQDDESRRAVIEGLGDASGGSETARVRSVMQVAPDGDGSLITIETDLEIRGRAASMGAGILATVGRQMVGRTARCLEQRLGSRDLA